MYYSTLGSVMMLSLLALSALAQTGSGGLAGTVRDESGAAIPAVTIGVQNQESGSQLETVSNDDGHFRVTSLLPGTYRVQAVKPGFEKVLQQGLVITTGQTIAVDLTLKVG